MHPDVLIKQFNKIGASIELEDKKARESIKRRAEFEAKYSSNVKGRKSKAPTHIIDILLKGKDEIFIVDTLDNKKIEVEVLETNPNKKHLLLMLKNTGIKVDGKAEISKYLCGHDERHWFVATIPESAHAKNIEDAMKALKPEEALAAQSQKGIKLKNKNKRKNKGYIRQGEWFFIPEPDLDSVNLPVYKNEPISRGQGSKPHICEELVRIGGVETFVHNVYASNGISKEKYIKFMKKNEKKSWMTSGWTQMLKDAKPYARGRVTHADHATVTLIGWHLIVPNTESKALAGRHVVFLD